LVLGADGPLVDEHSARWFTSAILGREGMQCKGQRRDYLEAGGLRLETGCEKVAGSAARL
jgi:hypothetical protein